jgi:hypothetical protein
MAIPQVVFETPVTDSARGNTFKSLGCGSEEEPGAIGVLTLQFLGLVKVSQSAAKLEFHSRGAGVSLSSDDDQGRCNSRSTQT